MKDEKQAGLFDEVKRSGDLVQCLLLIPATTVAPVLSKPGTAGDRAWGLPAFLGTVALLVLGAATPPVLVFLVVFLVALARHRVGTARAKRTGFHQFFLYMGDP